MSPPTCREVQRLLDDYGRGDLTRAEREAVELHLAGCERCREEAELWSGFVGALETAELDPLPPLVERRLAVTAAEAPTGAAQVGNRRSSRVRWAVGLSAAAALAAGVALVIALLPDDGEPGETTEPVAEQAAEPDPTETQDRDEPQLAGMRVATVGDGRQQIAVDDVTNLWMEQGSSVRVERLEPGLARFRLDSGRVVAEIGPHPAGYRFIVATPSGEVEAKGTIFAVEVAPDGAETARVIRGVVEVRARDEGRGEPPIPVTLRAGQLVRVGDTAPSILEPAVMGRDVCLLHGCARTDEPAPIAAAEASAGRTDPMPRPAVAGNDTKAGVPRGASKSAAAQGSGAAPAPADTAASKEAWEVETLVALALSHRKAGMYPMAAETYRRLIREHGDSAAARNALVSLGQLELVELGRPQDALRQFERYLSLVPGGLLAEEARLGRVRAYARMSRNQEVIGAASDYLRLHLGGYAGAEVTRMRGDAKRRVGDCLGAIADYRQVQSLWPTSKENTKAEQGLAACRAEP